MAGEVTLAPHWSYGWQCALTMQWPTPAVVMRAPISGLRRNGTR